MRSLICILCLVVWGTLFSACVHSQTIKSGKPPTGNRAVSVEKFEWMGLDKSKAPVAARFILKNKTEDKTIRAVQFTLVAFDDKGVTLQSNGATLRKLSSATTIDPEDSATIYFDKAFNIDRVANVELKQVVVEFSNGSLEILKK